MDEGRKRVLAIVAGILVARHLNTADDLFGGPQGSPRTDAMIAASVQWSERIMRKIDEVFATSKENGEKENRKERPLSMQEREEV